uniref:Uncharacterized protein n=1 Tax=Timema poppense TaxID=170557 RepID=A0A7R9DKC9_TIMPO|nr:unnamed protein product [Timema poppensis]
MTGRSEFESLSGTSFTAGDNRSDRTIPESWSWNRILVVSVLGPVVYCATGIVHPDFMCIPLCVLPGWLKKSFYVKQSEEQREHPFQVLSAGSNVLCAQLTSAS